VTVAFVNKDKAWSIERYSWQRTADSGQPILFITCQLLAASCLLFFYRFSKLQFCVISYLPQHKCQKGMEA